ncbi:hypothetical protein KC946_01150 [Candidatus Saccharibacteria bacterium]|nr:hypothetical protein [Candidatus Saccharibacteria bacterium]
MKLNINNFLYKPLIGLSLIIVLCASGVQIVSAASSSLGSSGKDTVTNSTSQTTAGNDVDWVVSYNNSSSGPANTVIDNTIAPGSTYKPNSVQLPPGWATSFSDDNGGSYGTTDTGSDTTDLKFTNPVVGNPSNGTSELVSQPLVSAAQSGTGEDAYKPIPFGGQIYGLIHHSGVGANEIVCSNKDGTDCNGYPASLEVSGQTDFYTSINPLHYVDQSNKRLFFAVQRDVGYGIACWDFQTSQLCAGNEYTELSASGTVLGTGQPSRLLGVIPVGSCLYAWDVDLVMYAFDPISFSTTCGGFNSYDLASTYSLPVYVPGQHNSSTSNYGPVASGEVIDNKIYFPINYAFNADINFFCGGSPTNYCYSSRLICFDPTDAIGDCEGGWTSPSLGGANLNSRLVTGIFKDINNSNNPCVFAINPLSSFSTATGCYDKTTGVADTVPTNLVANVVNNARTVNGEGGVYLMASYEEISTTNSSGDTISIFPFTKFGAFGNSITGGAGCYNWNIADECTGWGSNSDGETNWTSVNSGDTRDYGYAIDETGCLLGLGDSGWLWSFNTDDGSLPCQRTISVATLNPQAYYCSGSGSVSGWNQVETSNTNFADFDEILVTIKDTNGDVIPGYDGVDILPSSGILDISGIPYSGDTQDISVEVILIALNGDPWTGSNNPIITTTFFGDDAQICFQTVPQDNCDIPSIINGASSTTTQIDDGSVDTQVSNVSMGLILGNGTVCGAQTSQPNNGDTTTLASNNNPLADTGSPYSLFYMVGAGFILLAIIGILRRIQQ